MDEHFPPGPLEEPEPGVEISVLHSVVPKHELAVNASPHEVVRGPGWQNVFSWRSHRHIVDGDTERGSSRQKKIPKIHDSASVHALNSLPRPERVPATAAEVVEASDVVDAIDADSMVCETHCEGLECGPDGCGGDCGTCPEIAPLCNALGKCAMDCDPDCDGKDCGDDGCGGTCGACTAGLLCEGGACIAPPCDGVDCSGHGECVTDGVDEVCDCDPGFFAVGLGCLEADWVFSCTFTVESNSDEVGGNPSTDLFDPLEGVETDIDIYWNLISETEAQCLFSMDPEPCTKVQGEVVGVVMEGAVGALANYASAFKGNLFDFSLVNEGGSGVYRFGPNIVSEGSENFFGFELSESDVDVMIYGEYPVLENFIADHSVILRRYLSPSSMSDFAIAEATCTATEL